MKLSLIPCVILCGGKGSRLGKLTKKIPKPLLKISKHPIVYHIIVNYFKFGVRKFILLTGYRHNEFENYFKSLKKNKVFEKKKKIIKFKVRLKEEIEVILINTGLNTLKKNRLLLAKRFIENDTFFLTYGDGLGIVNIKKQLIFHKKNKKIMTLLGTNPPSRFGEVKIKKNKVMSLNEKPLMSEGLINGGYMVMEKKIFKYFSGNNKDLEHGVINRLCKKGEVAGYINRKFWQCMDNEREFNLLKKELKNNLKLKLFFNL